MAKSMFQSYKGALIFAGSTLVGVALLVGSEDKEGALVVAAAELERQAELADEQDGFGPSAAPAENPPVRNEQPAQQSESYGFTPDEELIDDTMGFDPTPPTMVSVGMIPHEGKRGSLSDSQKSSSNNSSNELAEERTDMAEDRTIMATERTFAGWMRTAFAAIGIGLGFRVVFGEFDPPWLARAIATGFILMGAVVAFAAERRTCHTLDRLQSHQVDAPKIRGLSILGWTVSASAILLAIALWILHEGLGD